MENIASTTHPKITSPVELNGMYGRKNLLRSS